MLGAELKPERELALLSAGGLSAHNNYSFNLFTSLTPTHSGHSKSGREEEGKGRKKARGSEE